MVTLRVLSLASLYQLVATVLVFAATFWLWRDHSLAALVGGALMAANFWALRFFAARALKGGKPRAAYAVLLGFKFVAVMGLMALLVLVLRLDPLGLAVGMSDLLRGGGARHRSQCAHAAIGGDAVRAKLRDTQWDTV